MGVLDSLNVAFMRYVGRTRFNLSPELREIRFTDFKPAQTSTQCAAQLLGRTEDGDWFYANIVINLEEIQLNHPFAIFQLIKCRVRQAVDVLNELADDSFVRWVREVRAENGIQDT